jgi:hypothetical protein
MLVSTAFNPLSDTEGCTKTTVSPGDWFSKLLTSTAGRKFVPGSGFL